jgi:hypothetical protein
VPAVIGTVIQTFCPAPPWARRQSPNVPSLIVTPSCEFGSGLSSNVNVFGDAPALTMALFTSGNLIAKTVSQL